MQDPEKKSKINSAEPDLKVPKPFENGHLGSSNAFEETENPLSRDADDISDEKLDELLETD